MNKETSINKPKYPPESINIAANKNNGEIGLEHNEKPQAQKPEDTLRELMVFFNAMDDVLFSVDIINNRVIQISPACEKLYGYKQSHFLKNHLLWFELIHPEDKHIIGPEAEILKTGKTISNQYRIIRKDHAIRWVENKIIPSFDQAGKLIRVDGITRDITESKASGESLSSATSQKCRPRSRSVSVFQNTFYGVLCVRVPSSCF